MARNFYDLMLAPLVAAAAVPMRKVRNGPVSRIPRTLSVLRRTGVFPIRGHYYEPLFDTSSLRRDNAARDLPGVDFAIEQQSALLQQFTDTETLRRIPADKGEDDSDFYMNNGNFGAGDAEIWYHVIRHFKPKRIVEIGSGYSTRMAKLATESLKSQDPAYDCEIICIEPYEMPWLEEIGVHVLRQKLEDSDPALFQTLTTNDILFIDSSHIIRPQGEVLQEFLQILPRLNSGVIVHVHDIFSPRDYPIHWLEEPRFWNEQYLLEAFLTHNSAWEVLLGVNLLKHERYALLKAACPHLDESNEPGSFYMRRL